MLNPVHLRDLLVDPAAHPRGQPHLSAASGLVAVGQWLYVVADDEHHLGLLDAGGNPARPVQLHRVLAGDLPDKKGKRKKLKPDLEALAFLPATPEYPHGFLLALGSGSRPNRHQAFGMQLDGDGKLYGEAEAIDLAALYEPLRANFPDLNIEGAFVADGCLQLLQRGNKGDATNACIAYSVAQVQDWIPGRRAAPAPMWIRQFALGEMAGVPLGFTDGAALPGGGWIFSAVAENTGDSYRDGPCGGSVIGWVSADGELQLLVPIAGAPKVEGLALDGDRLLMVTDSDDPATASQLLALDIPVL